MKLGQIVSLSTLGLALSLTPVLAISTPNASSDQYTYSAAIISVEQVGSKPIPTEVTWVESITAEEGTDVTLDHFTVVVLEDDEEIASIDVTSDQRSLILNKSNVEGMKVYSRYTVRVDEHYTDTSFEEGFEEAFYTAPPKLKNLRVKNKTLVDGEMTVTLKWRQPTNFGDDYIYYDYKIVRANNDAALVKEDYEWGTDVNSTEITGLPLRKLKVRVRARDDYHGAGPWSSWKTFQSVSAE